MTEPNTILRECLAHEGIPDVDTAGRQAVRFMRGWLAYKQRVAHDGPWDESYLVALEEMMADLEMSFNTRDGGTA